MKRQHLTVVMDGTGPQGVTVAAEGEGLLRVRTLRIVAHHDDLPRAEVEVLDLSMHAEVDGWVGTDSEYRARRWLEQLGRLDHPDAARDPIGALGHVAAAYQAASIGMNPPVEEEVPPGAPEDFGSHPPDGDDH
jgi:hypothetical protein